MVTQNKYPTNSVARKPQKKRLGKMVILLALGCVIVVAGLAAWLVHRHSSTSTAAASAARAANSEHVQAEQKNGKSTSSSQQESSSTEPPATQTNKEPTSSGAANQGGQTLESPGVYSTFVSSHTLKTDSPAQTVCVTTPGASCGVEFIKGTTTKTIQAQTTDSTGAVYFNWTPSSTGLTPGSWTILLKASLNGESKSAQDSQALQITS